MSHYNPLPIGVIGQVQVTIYKAVGIGAISGGDAGPATASPVEGVSYSWNLPLAHLYSGSSTTTKNSILQTLTLCMNIIGGVAQSSCQSYSMVGSGDYDGQTISIGGIANTGGSTPTTGQLQIHGAGIDLSGANEPDVGANLSALPVGTYIALPVIGSTTRFLTLSILD